MNRGAPYSLGGADAIAATRHQRVGSMVRIRRIERPGAVSEIEVVRGRLDRKRADELLSFWFKRRALSGLEARRRLPEVVCLLRRGGVIAGSCSAYADAVGGVGGRRFWVYRSVLDQSVADQGPQMIRATFTALEQEFDGSPGSPVGLCVLIGDPEELRRRPEAEWSDPRMIYAGYVDGGRQVRIAYFEGAKIA